MLMSYTTRLTPLTSLMIRVEMRGQQVVRQVVQSAVMKSSVVTPRTRRRVLVGAGVAHHADALHGQQHGEGLRRLAIEAGAP